MDASLYEKNIRLLDERPHFARGIEGAASSGLEFETIETKVDGCPSLRATWRVQGRIEIYSDISNDS